ncbi:uracil-DNA glycosylase [bacterium]|nr:MAG: uracil-DNA glycosylase [bacterium]
MSIKKKTDELLKINRQILKCSVCLKSAKGLLVPGEGSRSAEIVLVGEAPGKNEAVTGKPFIGRAGKLLDSLLETIKLDRNDIFITSAVKYLPKTYITPKPADIEHGRIHLFAQLEAIQPRVIVLMGNTAAMAVLHEKFSIAKDHGKFIIRDGLIYFLSYHPAAPLYSPKLREIIIKDFKKLKRYIK